MIIYATCHVSGNENDETMTFAILKQDHGTDSGCYR